MTIYLYRHRGITRSKKQNIVIKHFAGAYHGQKSTICRGTSIDLTKTVGASENVHACCKTTAQTLKSLQFVKLITHTHTHTDTHARAISSVDGKCRDSTAVCDAAGLGLPGACLSMLILLTMGMGSNLLTMASNLRPLTGCWCKRRIRDLCQLASCWSPLPPPHQV